jgi:ureidoglycolate lyase
MLKKDAIRTVKIEELSLEEFRPFGAFSNQLNPNTEKIGAKPVEFFRDMTQQDLGRTSTASFSTCRVENRKWVIDVCEYHSSCAETLLPLDNDILIHVAPATPNSSRPPLEKIRVFRVPHGTLVVLRPGVWHHAPFTITGEPANVLVVLPERTYANDCVVVELPVEDQIEIVWNQTPS